MSLTVEQLITALDAKSIHYRIIQRGAGGLQCAIEFNDPFSKRHKVIFSTFGEFMQHQTVHYSHREHKDYGSISQGEKYKAKLLDFLTK